MEDRSYVRMGGMAAVIGGLLALVANVLHPRWTDTEDVELYTDIADSGIWVADHLVLVVALILTIAGVVAIARSLEGGDGDTLARYGSLATVIGGAVALAQASLDGYAMRAAAEAFVHASDQDRVGAFWAANAIDKLGTGMFSMWTIVLLGVSPVLLGLAALRTRRMPAWLGWTAIVGGLVCTASGVAGLADVAEDASVTVFLVGSLFVTVWVIGAGWVLWHTADEGVPAAAG
jgi:hypothetical protein